MKTIGIIGGMAWPSSAAYYQKINQLIAKRLGGLHSAELILAQTDFEPIERWERESCWEQIGAELVRLGKALKQAGADFFLISCNTVHAATEQIESRVGLPFIHIVDPTAQSIRARGYKTVGLLGSRYTMCGDFFVKRLENSYGLRVLIPQGAQQDNVHNALYQELVKGIVTESARVKFRDAITDLIMRGAQTIVLGCTEFGMVVGAEDSSVPVIDTTVMHVESAVNAALAD
jgi:aspartate racemase